MRDASGPCNRECAVSRTRRAPRPAVRCASFRPERRWRSKREEGEDRTIDSSDTLWRRPVWARRQTGEADNARAGAARIRRFRPESDWLRHDRPAEHHVVVLMRQVMAMRHVIAAEGPEPPEESHLLSGIEGNHVFFARIVRVSVGAAGA